MENIQHPDEVRSKLERCILAALNTYSNIHRGSGHFSAVTTELYEVARKIVLSMLDLSHKKYFVIFCSPYKAVALTEGLKPNTYQTISSKETGLNLGVCAIVVLKRSLPAGPPVFPGGGAASLVSPNRVNWAPAPGKFEAGTPAIINVIAFACALKLMRKYGKDILTSNDTEIKPTDEYNELTGHKLLEVLKREVIGIESVVPVHNGECKYINFDNAASTQTFRPVFESFMQSIYLSAKPAQKVVENTKQVCSRFLNAPLSEYEVFFTSNTTESINIVGRNLSRMPDAGSVLNTILEHNSNELPWRYFSDEGPLRLNVDGEGFINLRELESILEEHNSDHNHGDKWIGLVTISGASNVLGSCNDLTEISRIVHQYGARLLVDAAQLVAHRKIDMIGDNIDFLAFSAHKAYAPFGTGVLVTRRGLLQLSEEEKKLIISSGEENIAGIAALGSSLMLLGKIGMEVIREDEKALTSYALKNLSGIEGIKIHGISDHKAGNLDLKTGVIAFSVKKMWPNQLAKKLTMNGIGVRYGCHCAHMLIKQLLNVPPKLQSFQHFMASLNSKIAFPGVTRISFGLFNTTEEVDKFVMVLRNMTNQKYPGQSEFNKRMKRYIKASLEKVYGLE